MTHSSHDFSLMPSAFVIQAGKTPLHWAACLELGDVAGLLVSKGANLEARDLVSVVDTRTAIFHGFKDTKTIYLLHREFGHC